MSRPRAGGLMVVTRPDVLLNDIWTWGNEDRRLSGVEVVSRAASRNTSTVQLPLVSFVDKITNEQCKKYPFYWWIKGGVVAKWVPERELYALRSFWHVQ